MWWKRSRLIKWVGLLVLVVIAACTMAPIAPAPDSEVVMAHEFSLTTLDGDSVTLAGLRGKRVLINFWATWCKPCLEEMPMLEALHREHADQVVVLGINLREKPEVIREFTAQLQITYPILLAPDDATVIAYGVRGLPISYLIDGRGRVVRRFNGALTPELIGQIVASEP